MALNGISVGKDISITFNDNNGNVVTTRVKNFSAKQETANRSTIALDGVARHLNMPIGWSGNFEFERTGPEVDTYIYNLEASYASGTSIPLITITETITEATGAVTQFQYQGCVVQLDSSGDWKGDDLTTQKVNFMATAKVLQA